MGDWLYNFLDERSDSVLSDAFSEWGSSCGSQAPAFEHPDLDDRRGDIMLNIVAGMTSDSLCLVHAAMLWNVWRLKQALQKKLRIPAVQQVLLVGGALLENSDVLHAHIPAGLESCEISLIRSNPSKKLYWKIALKEPQTELRTLVASRVGAYASFSMPPYFHVRLSDYELPEFDMDIFACGRTFAPPRDSPANEHRDSVLEGLSGDEVEFTLEALVERGPMLCGIVLLPEQLSGACGKEGVIHLRYDFTRPPSSALSSSTDMRSLRRQSVTPITLRGFVELKCAWGTQPPCGFFPPSKPTAKTRETKYGLRDTRVTFQAEIVEGRFVFIKKHSSMNCAMIGFKVQCHRDSLLASFSREPLSVRGCVVDVKPHFEKQDDGSRVEVLSCAFAAWPKMLFKSVRELRQLIDHLCECCHEGAAAEVTASVALPKPQVIPAAGASNLSSKSGKGRGARGKGEFEAEHSSGKQGQQDRDSGKGQGKCKLGGAKGGQGSQKRQDRSNREQALPHDEHDEFNFEPYGKGRRKLGKGKGRGHGYKGGGNSGEHEEDRLHHHQHAELADYSTKGLGNVKYGRVKGKESTVGGKGRDSQRKGEAVEELFHGKHGDARVTASKKGQGKSNCVKDKKKTAAGHLPMRMWQPKV